MAYEDVDWCLRAWQAGFRVLYFPSAQLVHHESVTRGTEVRASASSPPSACSGSAGRTSSTRARSAPVHRDVTERAADGRCGSST